MSRIDTFGHARDKVEVTRTPPSEGDVAKLTPDGIEIIDHLGQNSRS